MDSVTEILLDLSLPTVHTILHNSRVLFVVHCINSNNDIVTFLNSVGVLFLIFYALCFYAVVYVFNMRCYDSYV